MTERCAQPSALEAPDADPAGLVAENARLLRETRDLRDVLESRPVIDQATGILMAMYAVDAGEASRLLCRWSQVHDLRLRELAASVVGRTTSDPRRPEAPQGVLRRAPSDARSGGRAGGRRPDGPQDEARE